MAAATVAPASAINNVKPFGQSESLNDSTGAPMITYTVHGLNASSDAVFHNGQLYEANVTFGETYAKPFTPENHDALGPNDYIFTFFKEGEILPLTN